MSSTRRTNRVSERLRELVANEILRSSDPRFNLVTITFVKITTDLREAKIYWNVHGEQERIAEVEQALIQAEGYFKREAASKLGLRYVPKLKFFYDNTLDTVEEVNRLMSRIKV